MKTNTQKLLVCLYSREEHTALALTQPQLHAFLPELSAAGLRSAMYRLIDKGLVKSLSLEGRQQYYLTSKGSELVSRLFPALSFRPDAWQARWLQVVFLSGPAHDNDFRLLRSELIQRGACSITRGVYLLPDISSESFIKRCKKDYQDAVQIQVVASWILGGEREWVMRSFELESIASAYSGVSKEVDGLLSSLNRSERLTEREKKHISLGFSRFWEVLGVDSGITPSYITDSPHPLLILGSFQHLVQHSLPQE